VCHFVTRACGSTPGPAITRFDRRRMTRAEHRSVAFCITPLPSRTETMPDAALSPPGTAARPDEQQRARGRYRGPLPDASSHAQNVISSQVTRCVSWNQVAKAPVTRGGGPDS